MKTFKKEFKDLYKAYEKQLKKHHTLSLEGLTNSMDYFVTYLKFMRDYYILTEPLVAENGEENLKIASLATAISAYTKYQTCKNWCDSLETSANKDETLLKKYTTEKDFHWNSFWNIIRLNMEAWTTNA